MSQNKGNTPTGPQTAEPDGDLTVNEEAQPTQVKATDDRSEGDLKRVIVARDDVELGALKEPEHVQDQTSAPTKYAPADRPPWATRRYDEAIVTSAVKGANRHEPPDPDKFDPDGRPRD